MIRGVKRTCSILIVEDDSEFAQLMSNYLQENEYRVMVAPSGQQGIDFMNNEKVDLVILDLVMPGVNGWNFLDFKRQNQNLAKIPVIVVSAFGEIAKSVQPDAVLIKPVKPMKLLEMVQKYSA